MLNALFSFIVILLFAFSLYKLLKLNPSFTPFISLTTLVSFIVILSLFNMLYTGVILVYIISIISFIFAVKKSADIKKDLKDFFTVGVILFTVVSLLMLLFLNLSQPLFYEWDEFSFWGTSHKLLFINDSIYTFYESSLIGNTTPPTLAVLSYFFQCFNQEFNEWISFYSYNVLFFSIYCSFTAYFSKKDWYLSILTFIGGFFIPYFFTVYTKILHVSSIYINTYADFPLGIMFAGALAIYFLSKDNLEKRILPFIPITIFFTFIKDMGFAFSFLVAFIIFIELFFNKENQTFFFIKGILAKISAVLVIILTTIISFFSWAIHMGQVLQVNRFELGGDTNMGMVSMLTTGVFELFSSEKSQKFIDMQSEMFYAIFTRPVSMIGTGIFVIILILLIFILATTFSKKENRIKYLFVYIASLIGFIGYYIFHLFLYVYIFKANAYGLPSYSRYIYPYYIGWLMLGIFILIIAIKENEKSKTITKCILIIISIFTVALSHYFLNSSTMFLGINDAYFTQRNSISLKVDFLGDAVGDDDIIYVYNGNYDSGENWFIYTLEYAQNLIVQDVPYIDNEGYSEEEYIKLKQLQTIEYFKENNVTHFLLDHTGSFTEEILLDFFTESTIEYGLNGIAYYEIEYIDEDEIFFNLIKGEEFLYE